MDYKTFYFRPATYFQIDDERKRAHAKHGANGNSREDAAGDDEEWLAVLTEEVGEVAHELTYDAGPEHRVRLQKELIQVAAMAAAWIEALEHR